MQSLRGISGSTCSKWTTSHSSPLRKWDFTEPPSFPMFTANYLMRRKAVLRWKRNTDYPVEKLGNKVMSSLDWTVQVFVDARISSEALLQPDGVELIWKVLDAKACWIQEDESRLLMRKAFFSVERGGRVFSTVHANEAQIEAASAAALVTMLATTWGTVLKEGARLTKQSHQNPNTLLNGSTELGDVVRALNMQGVDTQEGTNKAAVKPVVHSFMETRGAGRVEQDDEEKEEIEEHSGALGPDVGHELDRRLERAVSVRRRKWIPSSKGTDNAAQELKKAAWKDRGSLHHVR